MKSIVTIIAVLGLAGPALADGCGWGHKVDAMASKAPSVEAPAQTTAPEIVVATVDCNTLSGDAKTACLTATE